MASWCCCCSGVGRVVVVARGIDSLKMSSSICVVSSSSGAGPVSSCHSPAAMVFSACLSILRSSLVGVHDSQPVASRSCVVPTLREFFPTCIQACFLSGSMARKRPRHQAPRLCCLALALCLQKATACPGSRWLGSF